MKPGFLQTRSFRLLPFDMIIKNWAVKFASTAIFISTISTAQDIQFQQDSPTEISFSIRPKFRLYNFDVEHPAYVIGPEKANIKIKALTPAGEFDKDANGKLDINVDGNLRSVDFVKGIASLDIFIDDNNPVVISSTDTDAEKTVSIKLISRYILLGGLVLVVSAIAALVLRQDKKKKPQETAKAS